MTLSSVKLVSLGLIMGFIALVSLSCSTVCADDGDCFHAEDAAIFTPTPAVLDGCYNQQWYDWGRRVEGLSIRCQPTRVVPPGVGIPYRVATPSPLAPATPPPTLGVVPTPAAPPSTPTATPTATAIPTSTPAATATPIPAPKMTRTPTPRPTSNMPTDTGTCPLPSASDPPETVVYLESLGWDCNWCGELFYCHTSTD